MGALGGGRRTSDNPKYRDGGPRKNTPEAKVTVVDHGPMRNTGSKPSVAPSWADDTAKWLKGKGN
jgi:hypothetical protein